MRQSQITGVGPAGPAFAGALFVTTDAGDVNGLFVGGRTSTPGGGGRYGLFYVAVPNGEAATASAWVYGLQQNDENRTNLALVNTGETDNSTDTFRIEIFDGPTGTKVATQEGISLGAKGWTQIGSVLSQVAPGTTQGYARITRTAGTNPFIVYTVVNDGATVDARSGDGAYMGMELQ